MKFRFLDKPESEQEVTPKSIFKDGYLPEVCSIDNCYRISPDPVIAGESVELFWRETLDSNPEYVIREIGTEDIVQIFRGNDSFEEWIERKMIYPELLFSIDEKAIDMEIDRELCKYLEIDNEENEDWIPVIGYRKR